MPTSSKESRPKVPDAPLEGLSGANATLMAWILFLGFGSAFLTFFYSKIHYFPELRWQDSFSYLAAISILGGGIVAIYGLLLFVPGWIWSEFLIFDTELQQGALCYRFNDQELPFEPCFWSISRCLVLPFFLLMVVLHLVLLADNEPWLLTTTFLVGLLAITWYSARVFSKELRRRPMPHAGATRRSLLVKYVLSANAAALAGFTSLWVIGRLVAGKSHSPLLVLICTIWVTGSNLLVAVQFRKHGSHALMTGIVAAITLVICGETFAESGSSLSERLLVGFGVGDTARRVTISPTAEGEKLLQGVPRDRLILLSRLGDEYLLQVAPEAAAPGSSSGKRFAIPKRLVSSWSSENLPSTSPSKVFSLLRLAPTAQRAYLIAWQLLLVAVVWMVRDFTKNWRRVKKLLRPQKKPRKGRGPRLVGTWVDSSEELLVELDPSLTTLTELGDAEAHAAHSG